MKRTNRKHEDLSMECIATLKAFTCLLFYLDIELYNDAFINKTVNGCRWTDDTHIHSNLWFSENKINYHIR